MFAYCKRTPHRHAYRQHPEADARETPHLRIGAEPGLRRLVRRFYELMDTLPEAWDVRKLHPQDLSAQKRSCSCISGWLGGRTFCRTLRPSGLRARHLPFEIASRERDQWMLCMRQALSECVRDEVLAAALLNAIGGLADPYAQPHRQLKNADPRELDIIQR